MSNSGIRIIILFIKNNIRRVSNANLISSDLKSALEKIIIYLETNIDTFLNDLNHLRLIHIKELIDEMKDTVDYLEKLSNKK